MALEQISKQNKRISGLLLRGKVRYWNHTGGKNAACLWKWWIHGWGKCM